MVDLGVDRVHVLCFVGVRRMSARRRTAAAPTHGRIVILKKGPAKYLARSLFKNNARMRLNHKLQNSVFARAPPYFSKLGVFCNWDIKILPDASEQTKRP